MRIFTTLFLLLSLALTKGLCIPVDISESRYELHEDALLDSLFTANDYDQLLAEITRIEAEIDWSSNSTAYSQFLYQQIRANYYLSDYIGTIQLGQVYISLKTGKESSSNTADICIYLGNSYLYLSEYSVAMDYYLRASDIYETNNNSPGQLLADTNIALIYNEIKDYEAAINRYKKTLKILKKEQDPNLSHNYTNLARSYISIKNYPMAKSYLDSALTSAIATDNQQSEAYIYRNFAWYYSSQEDYHQSESYFMMSLKLHEQLNDYHDITEVSILLSELYLDQGQYEKSLEVCLKYIQKDEFQNNLRSIRKLSEKLYDSYVGLSEYKSAIDVLDKYQPIYDTLESHRLKNVALMAQLRAQAANEMTLLKKQDEINGQTIKFQNTLLTIAIFGIIFLIGVAIFIYRSLLINKHLSELNKKQSERLTQLDEAKSRFFANISHDLRTPLSLIMGSIEQVLLSDDIHLTHKGERQLKVGLLNGQRIIHLTNEINELIKLEDSKLKIDRKYINIDHMLNLFVSMFNSMAEMKGVKLSYSKKILDLDPVVSIDINQFEKVLFNLITNALKHTKKDDSVTVSLDIVQDEVELSIVDSGEGIPEENVPFIFERYYQAPNTTFKTQEGFGIGLALVKEIIDKHEAEIEVKSKTGKGSQFTIRLPLETHITEGQITKLHSLEYSTDTRNLFKDIEEAESDDKPVVLARGNKNDGTPKEQTILLVEDHPEVRQYIQDLIEPYYNVITANNGKRALKILESKEVDLISTDLMMPWFDGFELLEKLKEDDRLSKIPVLVLSARTSEDDRDKVLSQGINDFLHKPFNANELLARIKNLLDRKSKWNSKNEDALFINNKETLSEIEKSLLQKVDNMIMQRIDDPNLAVPYLASEIAVSERKFFRMIKKLTGTTPYEYIKEFRLQYVNKLILDKKISSSSEAAKQIGMNNVSNFNNQFKSRFGKKPAEILK